MPIPHDWDHEINLGGDDIGLNNIKSKFLFYICFVFMGVDFKKKNDTVKSIKNLSFSNNNYFKLYK